MGVFRNENAAARFSRDTQQQEKCSREADFSVPLRSLRKKRKLRRIVPLIKSRAPLRVAQPLRAVGETTLENNSQRSDVAICLKL
jgi:hypothetical protein